MIPLPFTLLFGVLVYKLFLCFLSREDPKNTVCFSISLCHLWFLSSMFYSFLNTGFFCLFKFIPTYFILFVSMVNGIGSLNFLSEILFSVYRNESDFYVLILYSATLFCSLISSSNFLGGHLCFSHVLLYATP